MTIVALLKCVIQQLNTDKEIWSLSSFILFSLAIILRSREFSCGNLEFI